MGRIKQEKMGWQLIGKNGFRRVGKRQEADKELFYTYKIGVIIHAGT